VEKGAIVRVLIAEDDPISRRVLETMLVHWGYQTIAACDGREAWDVLQQPESPRLAILDWMMPEMTGVDVCRLVRQGSKGGYSYLILLTAKGRQEDVIEGMTAGADDYITKPFDSGELRARLNAARRILDLQAELIAAREALREQATRDVLTGLWNRSAILDNFINEISRASREEKPVGVIMGDVDNFKRVNDEHGHRAGDSVLKEVAVRMKSMLRPYDMIGRYGGEEFLMVLPSCDLMSAGYVAERIRKRVAGKPIDLPDRASLTVSMSFGVSAKLGAEQSEIERLIYLADEALYRAKGGGRNRIEMASAAAYAKF
jgi:diguanylate cyclase (GGDEF)-like protein